jgi:hypothetical protein
MHEGNPTVLLAKHVQAACEHLLLILVGWFLHRSSSKPQRVLPWPFFSPILGYPLYL